MRYLIYAGAGHISGRKLAQYMGIDYGKTMNEEDRRDYLIRYGSRKGVRYIPNERTINRKSALDAASKRYSVLNALTEAGIPVPPYSKDPDDLRPPILGRTEGGMGGDGITIFDDTDDATGFDFYMEYIPKQREFRAHVIGGKLVKVSEKIPNDEDNRRRVVWNLENGFTFRYPDNKPRYLSLALATIDALNLDFGAVDMLAMDEDPYILEVNTAPGIMGSTVETYATHLGRLIDLPVGNMPGWDNVDDELLEAA